MIGIRLKEADSEASRCRDINFYRKIHRCFKSSATLTYLQKHKGDIKTIGRKWVSKLNASEVKLIMAEDDGDSVVTLVSSVESVVTVLTAVESIEPVQFGRMEDEVDHVMEEEDVQEEVKVDHVIAVEDVEGDFEDEVEEEEDFKYGGFHPVRVGTCLSNRCFSPLSQVLLLLTSGTAQ